MERDIENALVKRVKALGGMAEKLSSPSGRSKPDRLITLPGGVIIFAEVKNVGCKPTRKQALDHERRRALGCCVVIIDSMEKAKGFPNGIDAGISEGMF